MRILTGWKEIGECLNLTSRTAQRWERLGLPVRRVSDSRRSPVIAFSDEIEGWVQKRRKRQNVVQSVLANRITFMATQRETLKLARQLHETAAELQRQMAAMRPQIHRNCEPSTQASGRPNGES